MNGLVKATLTLTEANTLALVQAEVGGSLSDQLAVEVIHPALAFNVVASAASVWPGEYVTYTYQLTNTGDITLDSVSGTDNNGTPEDADDFQWITKGPLAIDATAIFSRTVVVTQPKTSLVTASWSVGDYSDTVTLQTPLITVREERNNLYLPLIHR